MLQLRLVTTEPVGIGAAIGALIPLICTALTAFNAWNPTPDQTGALSALYAGVIVVIGLVVRSKVTPIAKSVQ